MTQKDTKERDYIAKLVIYDLPTMKSKELKRLSKWFFETSKVVLMSKDYSKRFTAKLMK